MSLGTTYPARVWWEQVLEKAYFCQGLVALSEEPSLMSWLDVQAEQSDLVHEVGKDLTDLEHRLITAMQESIAVVVAAVRAKEPLPDDAYQKWSWATTVALAINDEEMSRNELFTLKHDDPEQLARRLSEMGIAEDELPPRAFERPKGFREVPRTEESRQAMLASLLSDPDNER